MFLKLPGYIGLSLLSFCVFTWVFHTVDQAQAAVTMAEMNNPKPYPSPTLFLHPTINQQTMTLKQKDQPSPTPTIYIAQPTTQPTAAPEKQVVIKEFKAKITPTAAPIIPTAVPTAIPEPTAVPQAPAVTSPTDLDGLFAKYSGEYGVDEGLLKKIAKCESGFNPNANNSGMYLGMFQFASQTWSANRARMGLDTNPDLRTNAEEAIRTAAYVISRSGAGAWPNCH